MRTQIQQQVTPHPTLIESRVRMERQLLTAAASALIEAGYLVAVYDGDRYAQAPTNDVGAVVAAGLSGNEDHLHAYLPTERGPIWTGWVQLCYGSAGWDTMGDYSAKLSPALAAVVALAQQLRTARFIVQHRSAA